MTDRELVKTSIDGPVAELRFCRPEALNALNLALAKAFAAAVADVTARSAVRAIVISAEGAGFVAGGDVSEMAADPERGDVIVDQLLDVLNPAVLALRAADAPVIVAARGVAAGAGLSLLAGADLCVLDEAAKLVMAYDKVAGVPDCGGSWFLAHRIGRQRMAQMMLLGQPLSAAEALAIGLVTEICPAAEVEARARVLAERIAQGPTKSFGHFKRLVDRAASSPLSDQLEAERAAFVAAARTEDFRQGVVAFANRTKPVFNGR
jgi:2-(1,2-epoxy-1,2-dihydrophenyl)acetyl-CoA isomerase